MAKEKKMQKKETIKNMRSDVRFSIRTKLSLVIAASILAAVLVNYFYLTNISRKTLIS